VNIGVADEADDALEKNLKLAVNQRHVDIDVEKGVVTLGGEVRSEADRQAIDDIVRKTPGVAAVKNNLKVKLATPGTAATTSPSLRPSVPVYATAPPEVTTSVPVTAPAPVVRTPAPVVVPDYPKLKVQAWAEQDVTMANTIARQLRAEAMPATGFENVTINVRNGTASLQGTVTQQGHDMLIAAIQKTGGDLTAIYDQLQIK